MKITKHFLNSNISLAFIIASCLVFKIASAQQTFTNFQAATWVVGQPNFTTATATCTQAGLYGPSYCAISSKGVLAVCEQSGGRVKLWNNFTTNGQNADVVVGDPSFTTCSNTGTTQSSIIYPEGVAFSPDGNKLIVTDDVNHRVLIWNTIPTTNGQAADVVLGQTNFTTSTSGTTVANLSSPLGVFVSPNGKLIVADGSNNRVLIWNSIPTVNGIPADVVVGQPNFTTGTLGNALNKMYAPWGVWVSPDGKLLVADQGNHRVLIFNTVPTSNGASANVVIGTTSVSGTTSTLLSNPVGVTVSPQGQLAIGEFLNSRVLIYNTIPTTNGAAANVVLGQPNFTTNTIGSPTNQNMQHIYNCSFDLYGRLFVVGRAMHRGMVFGTLPTQTAELSTSMNSTSVNACSGSNPSIKVTVTNNGPNNATGVRVNTALPTGFTYTSHSASAGTYNNSGGSWNIGNLANGASVTLTINGTAVTTGNYTAYSSIVASNQLDNILTNNASSAIYTVGGNCIQTGTITGSPLCAGAAVSVPYTKNGTFTAGNVFTAQLSNAAGSFASPVSIGSLASVNNGTISATIPSNTPAGSGYQIRVVSNTPVITGTDNGSNITVTAPAVWYLDADNDGYYTSTQSACSSPGVGWIQTVTASGDCAPADGGKWQNLSGYVDADGDGYTVGTLLTNICSGASLPTGYVATSLGPDCDDSNLALTTNCSNFIWTGATSTAWAEPTNWSPNGLPNSCAQNVTIPTGLSTYPAIGVATYTVGHLNIEDGATLTINGNAVGGLKVCGDVTAGMTTNANILGNSTRGLILEGNFNQQIFGRLNIDRLRLNNSADAILIIGANVSINKALELQNGNLYANGQILTFKSTSATDYAILDNFSSGFTGTLIGNATAERFVPVTGINQHYFGSPVTNTTFAQLGASGTPGFVIPKPNCDQLNVASTSPYGNIFEWHDDIPANATCLYNGWEVKTAGTAQAGKGYSVYLPNGTFSITGPLNQGNSYSVGGLDDIGWTSNTLQTLSYSLPAYTSGWHIVANPFLAALELGGHTPDFDDAAVWVTSGAFSGSYQPVAITGGTIAPFQGFIVHRSSSSAATFTFDKNECRAIAGIQFYKTASEHAISLQVSGNGFNDITRVEFNAATTNTFDVNYDSRKSLSALGQPTIASFNSHPNERLSINVNKSIAETPNVQLNFVPGNNGTFTFTAAGINTFDPTSYVTLEDTKEGTMIDLRQNPTYTFTADKTDNHNRFVLHFTPAAVISTINGTCTENGTLSVTQDGLADWNYTITNSNDTTTIATGTLNSTSPINVATPMGIYQIALTDNSGYQVIKNVQVNGQTPIAVASMTASTTTIEADQTITLINTTSNPTTTEWNFGDGSTAITATVDHIYTEPGIYTVTLTVTNADGCQSITSQTITVTEKLNTDITTTTKESINIYPNPASTKLNIDISRVTAETQLTLTNALCQTVQTQDKLKQGVNMIDVSQLAEGLYLITVNEGKIVLTTQRIVISQ